MVFWDVCCFCLDASDWLSFVCLLFCKILPKVMGEEELAKASETEEDFFLAALISFLEPAAASSFLSTGSLTASRGRFPRS
jgi:hypothetical protein